MCKEVLVDSCVYMEWKSMLHVHVDHMVSDVVVVVPFQYQSPYTSDSEFEYDDSESESTSTFAESHLSSSASESQSSLKSCSDGHLKGPEDPLSKPQSPPRPQPLMTSQSTEESIVDQEGK